MADIIHNAPNAMDEYGRRNLAFDVAPGVTFAEGDRIGYDPETDCAVKLDTPGAIPLGEVQLFVPPEPGKGALVFVYTDDSFDNNRKNKATT